MTSAVANIQAATPQPVGIPNDAAFLRNLLDQLHQRFTLSPQLQSRIQEELGARLAPPRRSEIGAPLPSDRLLKENEALLTAFRKASQMVPHQHLPEGTQAWFTLPDGQWESPAALGAFLEGLEAKLGDSQLSQVYAGSIHFFDARLQKGQVLPINWEGFRFRLLAAAERDLSPRGHLNYYCSLAAKVIEILSEKGLPRPLLRQTAQTAINGGRVDLLMERNAIIANRFQTVLNELGEVLINIQKLAGDIVRNARAVNVGRASADEATFNASLTQLTTKQGKLTRTFHEVERTGIALPTGLREHLQEVVAASRSLTSGAPPDLGDPKSMEQFLRRVAAIKNRARGVTVEFRRIRRKTTALVRKTAASFGRAMQELLPLRIRDQNLRVLTDAARELMWSLEDVSYALEVEEFHAPELLRFKASLMDRRRLGGAMAELDQAVKQKPLDYMRLRTAGKALLGLTHEALQHLPNATIARNEDHPLWSAAADLAEAHDRFSTVIEGEELQRLSRLPQTLLALQEQINAARPNLPPVDVGPALQREAQCQSGELRLSVKQRLDNLQRPLQELTKISLTLRNDDPLLKEARNQAMTVLGVTLEPPLERGQNYLAELVVLPLAELFIPQDPTYGRSRSELELRLRWGPAPGVLPPALLSAARQPNSLADLGDPATAQKRDELAREVVNRSGLVGQVLGLHPNWDAILNSDEADMLAREMRPLFAGDAGQGFLVRLVAKNEEYGELKRLDEPEKLHEAALLLEALTSWDGFAGLQQTIYQMALLLSGPQLADGLSGRQDAFLRHQRHLLDTLELTDPLEHLHPPEVFEADGACTPFHTLLDEINDREEELCLLQLHHRKFLQPEVLALLVRQRHGLGRDLEDALPQLAWELKQRFLWLSLYGRNPAELASARWLLEELGMKDFAQGVEAGLEEMALLKRKIAYLKQLRTEQPRNLVERMLAFVSGTERKRNELESEIGNDFNRIHFLGFGREAVRLERELAR